MQKLLMGALIAALFVIGSVGWRWYSYVTNTESPYDEVGITFNSRMPYPLRKWGCDKLQKTFAGALPPYGCKGQGPSGRDWL